MELAQLRTFVAVAETESVTRAAERLFFTPPSASAHIRALEEELGVVLFIRGPRGMRLTSAGAILLPTARATLRAADDLQQQAARLREHPSGPIRLGINASARFLRLGAIQSALTNDFPDITLSCAISMTERIVNDLLAHNLELGFVFGRCDDPRLAVQALDMATLVVAAPPDWASALAGHGWEALSQFPWLGSTARCPFQELIATTLGQRGLEYRRLGIICDDETTKRELVAAGVGMTLLEQGDAERAAQAGEIYIWDGDQLRCPLSLVWLHENTADPAIAAVAAATAAVWLQPPTLAMLEIEPQRIAI